MRKKSTLKDQLFNFIKNNYSNMPFPNEIIINDFLNKYSNYTSKSIAMCLSQLAYKGKLKRLQRGIYIYNSNDKKD